MLAYAITFLFVFFGMFHFDIRKKKPFKNSYYFIVFIAFTLLSVLRYRVGGDSLLYENTYGIFPKFKDYFDYLANDNILGYQPLWLLLVSICKSISTDYYLYQAVYGIIFNVIFFWFIRKHSSKPFTTLFIVYTSLLYFYFSFEIQREILAICCFMLGYESFLKNRWWKYYLFAILAFMFHISAIILIVLPLFKLIKFNRTFVFTVLLLSIPLIAGKAIFYDALSYLFFTETMQKKGEAYSEFSFSISGIILFYFIRVLIFLPFIFYYLNNKFDKKDWLLSSFLVLSIMSQVMVSFDRLLNYIYLPFIIFFVDFIYTKKLRFKFRLQKKNLAFSLYFGIFLILGNKLVFGNYQKSYYYSIFFPYESILHKQKDDGRERYLIDLWNQ